MNYSKKAKNTIILLLSFVFILAGCGKNNGGEIVADKLNVVTSFYPIYEFATAIGGEDVNVINLLPTGVEPHDWTPKSKDILNTSKAQLFLYNGAGLEGWVPNFLKGMGNGATVKALEVSQGVDLIYTNEDDGHNHGQAGEDHDGHDHEAEETGHDHHAEEHGDHFIDPHTWVSPKSAIIIAENIKNSFIEVDPEHAANYESRYIELSEKLKELDLKFTTELAKTDKDEIVVSHQAFGYLCRDYGLTQHAIMGLSPDAEPRGQDIVALSKMVKEQGIKYIFFEELVSDKLAKTLAGEADVETLVLNPVEGLTSDQLKAGDNYFTLMEKNLQNLILALQ